MVEKETVAQVARLTFFLFIFLCFKVAAYNGRVLVVSGDRAVVVVDPKKVAVGDELMFYDQYLVQLGTASVEKIGKKRSRAVVETKGFKLKKGYTYSLFKAKGEPAKVAVPEDMKFYVGKKEPEKLPNHRFEIVINEKALAISYSEDQPIFYHDVKFNIRLLKGLYLGIWSQGESPQKEGVSRHLYAGTLGLFYPEDNFHQNLFMEYRIGYQDKTRDSDGTGVQAVELGLRVRLSENFSYRPTLDWIERAALSQQKNIYSLNILSFSVLL